MRSDVMRWLTVAVLAPIMALGAIGGERFLVHSHDEHGTHWHPLNAPNDTELGTADHAHQHERGHAAPASDCTFLCDRDQDRDGPDEEPCEVPEGVIVSIDVHKQLPTRGTDLGKSLLSAATLMIAVFAMPPSPDLERHIGSPGGSLGGGPMDLIALSASDRLVRTSRALLI